MAERLPEVELIKVEHGIMIEQQDGQRHGENIPALVCAPVPDAEYHQQQIG